MPKADTIFALSSAPGRAGVAVVRISGPAAGEVVDRMAPPRGDTRRAVLRHIRHHQSGDVLDDALVLWLQGPRTETGEDMAELHLHGSPAIVSAVLEALGRFPGCRMAEAGEFTIRSFRNGKIDLAQVEGLADLIAADTEAQRKQALAQAQGALSKLCEGWRGSLIEASALAEAAIDFSDEADVADDAFARARAIVAEVLPTILAHLDDGHRGEILRDGFRVVLAGAPNAGKSSLLNALARRDAAIVSDEAGTTRDAIEVRLDLSGLPVIVTDTAGIREATGAIEREGIRRSLEHVREADLVLWLCDAREALPPMPAEVASRDQAQSLTVATKIDLLPAASPDAPPPLPFAADLAISVRTGEALNALVQRIAAIAGQRIGDQSSPALTRERHRESLNQCAEALARFLAGDADQHELRAEDLRMAVQALGRITGRVDVEDILGQIFSRFCIGK
ncbi:tRNA uridine-5-carboxymethylaminomethyl(34) synthesis GTPase MnmE [Hyphomicrobium sulfonivorans]|uniref:tRNA uridine-5-carboxymethylaminomethyl(34) synthesis GTPase MnmE n=1 Tax=Hyphomicrobium sulfonivorans TaxID=121290 RepID=UPI00156E6F24|nr:tRNA uridine-5-carboxymethylaminomethyl(34) synthesis GTPase MnmE [Hyphomicrobium sulfonivorans]MBI1648499.1 tRNA uridine-5-carboxymethylaminomethyl(34) synthesis GTPase MnmE [Hyphomicrobium sulfonivorans]NSL70962.1 tRNA uridine-5-carboxymethylaminomethyl(34) synthesis GTPase MnmE [Hyphomicrobium sulfonivorans]